MKKRLFSIALCLTFILSATSVSAQDAAYREALSKMLEASGAMTTVKSMVPQMIGMMKHTYSNVPDEFWKNFEEQLSEKANTQFLDIYVSIYHRYLTISDLKKITAFYESPVGKKLAVIAAYSEAYDFDGIFPISARTRDGLDELLDEFKKHAVEGPQLFPDGMTTDQPDRQVVGEIVREKLLRNLDKEIPHGTAVEITRFIERDDEVIEVDATIYCEKASHKGIIIGKNGAMLKKISTEARQDIERFMGTKVYLETWVKVKENWRDNMNYIRSFGYNDQ